VRPICEIQLDDGIRVYILVYMNNATSKTDKFDLPVNLSFDGRGGVKPGRGEAGWTMISFESEADRSAFMKAHREAAMPCWRRIA
jgi:hypothetical protein